MNDKYINIKLANLKKGDTFILNDEEYKVLYSGQYYSICLCPANKNGQYTFYNTTVVQIKNSVE